LLVNEKVKKGIGYSIKIIFSDGIQELLKGVFNCKNVPNNIL